MRFVALSASVVLLAGCSWPGGFSGPGNTFQYGQSGYAKNNQTKNRYASSPYNMTAPGHMGAMGGQNPCVIFSPVQPIPTGCHPSQVNIQGQNGFGAGPTLATGGFGSHVQSAHRVGDYAGPKDRIRKPKLRGTMSFGTEQSVAGTLVSPDAAGFLYDPSAFAEGVTNRTADLLTTTEYSAIVEGISSPSLSFNDIHQSPLSIKAGAEYIVNPRFSLFANGGYTHATGANDASSTVIARLTKTVTEQALDPLTGAAIGTPIVNTEFLPNKEVANFVADFSEHRQFDLEVGARRYFDPIYKEQGYRTITPFVGAAVGLSHVNNISFKTQQSQLFLEEAFQNGTSSYYEVPTSGTVTKLYEPEVLVNGALTAGLEWQLSPSTALAFESGLKAYQNRSFVSGDSGDMNVVVPLTLRGSYNF